MIGSITFSFPVVGNNDFPCAGVLSVKCGLASSNFETMIGTPIGELTYETNLVIDGEGSASQWFKSFVAQKDGIPACMFAKEKAAAQRPIFQKHVRETRFRFEEVRTVEETLVWGRTKSESEIRISKGLGGAS
ncbi:MAG TPA: hypothetical protein VMZ30_06005 [Pyrinomonadaceae bacterium]|nr:hypothetical protein [Pyrinomonadaceae bacterium]